jgi:hypothetical protein
MTRPGGMTPPGLALSALGSGQTETTEVNACMRALRSSKTMILGRSTS